MTKDITFYKNREDFILNKINEIDNETITDILLYYAERIKNNEMIIMETDKGEIIVTEFFE